MRLLDLFCGAGGAAMGYHRAGFAEIVGVDIKPQPRYPFAFVQADAMTFRLDGFDAIHASPPCQAYTHAAGAAYRRKPSPRLISSVRRMLRGTGVPSVIENVPGARREMECPLMLCGTMFGLNLYRHRYFETWPISVPLGPASCNHQPRPVLVYTGSDSMRLRRGPVSPTGTPRRKGDRNEWGVQACREAMEVPWMTREGIDQAIPPAYTEFIGKQLLRYLNAHVSPDREGRLVAAGQSRIAGPSGNGAAETPARHAGEKP